MRRDLDLIRKILLAIEDAPSGWAPPLSFEEYSPEEISYHAYLLIDAGLAKGHDVTHYGSESPVGHITHLTWEGHEFAAVARDETVWKEAMERVKRETGGITLGVMRELLTGLIRGALGLQ